MSVGVIGLGYGDLLDTGLWSANSLAAPAPVLVPNPDASSCASDIVVLLGLNPPRDLR